MYDINKVLLDNASLVEESLKKYLHSRKDTTLYGAMEYSLMCGGKRIRPFLTIEFCKLFGGDIEAALPYAMAIEMIHTFSLIHDDMPCMDNDDFRRGKPTNHKVYGEATALLAGDAMIFSAFECALSNANTSSENKLLAVQELAKGSGADGMCEGQMLDLAGEGNKLTFDELLSLHAHKTGCLIRVAAKLGAIAANADEEAIKAADTYGAGIGLAFQIIDDILDRYGDADSLGKPVGSDAKNMKTTFLNFMDVDKAMEYAKKITEEACKAISKYDNSETLIAFANMLLDRKN